MEPATPTPFFTEIGEPLITLPYETYSIWAYSDDTINVWNRFGNFAEAIQWLIVFGLVVAFVILMTRMIQRLVNRDAE